MSRFRWSDRLRGGLRDADYGYWRESRFNAPLIQDFGQARLQACRSPKSILRSKVKPTGQNSLTAYGAQPTTSVSLHGCRRTVGATLEIGRRRLARQKKKSDCQRRQDAVAAVLIALDRYEEPRASLRTYVERVASNAIASTLRRARTEKRTSVDYWPVAESPRVSLIVELRLDLNRALRALGRPERRVARLLEEYRPGEIARALGISRTAVYRSIDRIREAFVAAGLG